MMKDEMKLKLYKSKCIFIHNYFSKIILIELN